SRLGVQDCVKKPFRAKDLAERTQPSRPASAVQRPGSQTRELPNLIGQGATPTAALDDSGFHAVLSEEFLSGKPQPFDVFVRVAPGQYVRVLNAGDAIEPERV